jgi:polysaccharide pyruvyl transferase WcaK-like protein
VLLLPCRSRHEKEVNRLSTERVRSMEESKSFDGRKQVVAVRMHEAIMSCLYETA